MFLADRLTLDAPTRTRDGYLSGRARVARTGIYDYVGHEVDPDNAHGLRDKAVVRVFRPGDEVFDKASLASFVGKPITSDHPSEAVNSRNWRRHARGTIMGAVRDGEYVGFDYLITDSETIAEIEAGKRELSNGYAVDLEFTPGTFNGETYDAVQRSIRGNHLAVVDRARGGRECRIADRMPLCDAIAASELERLKLSINDLKDGTMPMHTLTIDGVPVTEVSDGARAAIEKLQGRIRDADSARDKALADIAALTAEKQALHARVVTLEKQINDARPTPQQLREAALAYRRTADAAKALGVCVSDDMDEPAIMKAAVSAKLGDAAKDWDERQIAVSFASLTAGVKADDSKVVSLTPATHTEDKVAALYDKMVEDMKAAARPAAAA